MPKSEKKNAVILVLSLALIMLALVLIIRFPVKPSEPQPTPSTCTPDWQCGAWNSCSASGAQTRTCTDANACDVGYNKPTETQFCTPPCVPNWQCSAWTECNNWGNQSRVCTDANHCNLVSSKPNETQQCPLAVYRSISGFSDPPFGDIAVLDFDWASNTTFRLMVENRAAGTLTITNVSICGYSLTGSNMPGNLPVTISTTSVGKRAWVTGSAGITRDKGTVFDCRVQIDFVRDDLSAYYTLGNIVGARS